MRCSHIIESSGSRCVRKASEGKECYQHSENKNSVQKMSVRKSQLTSLPRVLDPSYLEYLPVSEIMELSRTSKELKQRIESDPVLWQKLAFRDFNTAKISFQKLLGKHPIDTYIMFSKYAFIDFQNRYKEVLLFRSYHDDTAVLILIRDRAVDVLEDGWFDVIIYLCARGYNMYEIEVMDEKEINRAIAETQEIVATMDPSSSVFIEVISMDYPIFKRMYEKAANSTDHGVMSQGWNMDMFEAGYGQKPKKTQNNQGFEEGILARRIKL